MLQHTEWSGTTDAEATGEVVQHRVIDAVHVWVGSREAEERNIMLRRASVIMGVEVGRSFAKSRSPRTLALPSIHLGRDRICTRPIRSSSITRVVKQRGLCRLSHGTGLMK